MFSDVAVILLLYTYSLKNLLRCCDDWMCVQDSAARLRSVMSANVDMRMRKREETVWRHPQHPRQ